MNVGNPDSSPKYNGIRKASIENILTIIPYTSSVTCTTIMNLDTIQYLLHHKL